MKRESAIRGDSIPDGGTGAGIFPAAAPPRSSPRATALR